jgi:hypothetical protein
MSAEKHNGYATYEQMLLAKLLRIVVAIGLSLIVVGFVLYVSGVLPAFVTPRDVSQLWQLSSAEYQEATGIPLGWGWASSLGNGDIVSFSTLVLISLGAIACIAILSVAFFKKRNWPYAVIVVIQTCILVLAASGIVSGH